MDASGEVADAQISSETHGAGFVLAAPATIGEAAFSCAKGDVSDPRTDMDAESLCSSSLLASEEQLSSSRMKYMVDDSFGSSRFLAGHMVSPAREGSHESSRILLSCSLAGARVKKKRRSRASNKAPIKVFSTDTSNFMAMVHKLTGIPSNAPPFHCSIPSLWTPMSNNLPFNQGVPTLDTSTLLLPSLSCDRLLSGSSYSSMQAPPTQQHLSSISSSLKTTCQASQLPANMDCLPTSYSDLVRSVTSNSNSSRLPYLWDAAYANQKTAAHQLPQSAFSEKEFILLQKASHQHASSELKCPTSSMPSG